MGLSSDVFFSSGSLELEHLGLYSIVILLPSLNFAFLSLGFDVAESKLDLLSLRKKSKLKKNWWSVKKHQYNKSKKKFRLWKSQQSKNFHTVCDNNKTVNSNLTLLTKMEKNIVR